jgi:hypothetical protein
MSIDIDAELHSQKPSDFGVTVINSRISWENGTRREERRGEEREREREGEEGGERERRGRERGKREEEKRKGEKRERRDLRPIMRLTETQSDCVERQKSC